MKIQRIQVDNFLGARSIDAVLHTPVTLFCGPNGAGKSSIQEAVRMAITGDVVRVNLKKEYDQLVTEGSKAGGALLTAEAGTYSFDLPAGKMKVDDGLPAGESIAVALNGQRFASMSADDKRTFLFGLTGCRASTEEVQKRLLARNCEPAKVDAVMPMLRSGFPAAAEYAAEQAKQGKRDWRAETGATWGANVAERWKAETPAQPQTADHAEDLPMLEMEIEQVQQKVGAAAAALRAANEVATKREQLKTKAESVDRVRSNLELKCTELAEYEPEVVKMRQRASGTARVGLVHDMAAFLLDATLIPDDAQKANDLIERYEDEHGELTRGGADLDAKASLPEYERGLEVMQNAVKNLTRDLQAAIEAKAAYDSLEYHRVMDTEDLTALQQRLANLKVSRERMQADIRMLEGWKRDVAAAEGKTKKAAEHHAAVTAWLAIADALSPDGIPGQLLAEALQPLNSTLQIAAADTKWPCVCISPDMQITAGKRVYGLLSESEKWRVDAMIAQAVAKVSGHKMLMLDRMDVLDIPGRLALLQWLDMLAEDGTIDTALLFGTLKALPTGLPSTIAAYWIEDGNLVPRDIKAAA
jgi:hypothetical protein